MLTEFILVTLIHHLELTNCPQSKRNINEKSKEMNMSNWTYHKHH